MTNSPEAATRSETELKVDENRAAWAKPELLRIDAADAEAGVILGGVDIVFS